MLFPTRQLAKRFSIPLLLSFTLVVAVKEDAYDVIMVGAGLAGSVVAGKLSQKLGTGKGMLVLEAGKASQASLGGTQPPASCTDSKCALWPSWSGNETRFDVPGNYMELPCWDKSCDFAWHDIPCFQCKVLGGCDVVNGALIQHPQPEMLRSWPQGWKYDDLMPFFNEVELEIPSTPTPSKDGKHYLDDTGSNVLRDALSGEGFQWVNDTRQPQSSTMGIPRVAARDGLRMSTAKVFLQPALESNRLELLTEATVEQILHDGQKASGIRFSQNGSSRNVKLTSDGIIVLAAGAWNTPRVLLASGVGAPGRVGVGLSDKTIAPMTYKFPSSRSISDFSYNFPDRDAINAYLQERSGPLTQFGPTLAAFYKYPGSENGFDVEIFVNPTSTRNELTAYFVLLRPQCSEANITLSEGGVVKVEGSLYIGCEADRQVLQGAIDLVTQAASKLGGTALNTHSWPALAMNHFAGSCKLGSCVDASSLMVSGFDNIAVVDASIMPNQLGAHPSLTISAIAIKASQILASNFKSSAMEHEIEIMV